MPVVLLGLPAPPVASGYSATDPWSAGTVFLRRTERLPPNTTIIAYIAERAALDSLGNLCHLTSHNSLVLRSSYISMRNRLSSFFNPFLGIIWKLSANPFCYRFIKKFLCKTLFAKQRVK